MDACFPENILHSPYSAPCPPSPSIAVANLLHSVSYPRRQWRGQGLRKEHQQAEATTRPPAPLTYVCLYIVRREAGGKQKHEKGTTKNQQPGITHARAHFDGANAAFASNLFSPPLVAKHSKPDTQSNTAVRRWGWWPCDRGCSTPTTNSINVHPTCRLANLGKHSAMPSHHIPHRPFHPTANIAYSGARPRYPRKTTSF